MKPDGSPDMGVGLGQGQGLPAAFQIDPNGDYGGQPLIPGPVQDLPAILFKVPHIQMGVRINPDGMVGHCRRIGFFSHFYNKPTFVLN